MSVDRDIASLAALADPQRGRVFEQIEATTGATVSEVGAALGIGRTLVDFHLAKLVEAGLVEVVPAEKRLGARGRPSKRYRVSRHEVAASVPSRRYDLLAGVLLDAVAEHRQGEPAQTSARRTARRRGREIAREVSGARGGRSIPALLRRLEALLSSLGYLPARSGRTLTVRNCPFDKFRSEHTEQVCDVNLALAQGYLEGLEMDDRVSVALQPCPDTCCLLFEAEERNSSTTGD